jgi:predicted DNA-binding helix-hairpin-helix protein
MQIQQWNVWFGWQKLRTEHNFNGYIHLKSIPGASDDLMKEAALYADRLSVNLEIPTESGLKLLAPDKNRRYASDADCSERYSAI